MPTPAEGGRLIAAAEAGPPAPPSFRRDLISAYGASGARAAAWVAVSALVYRASPDAFALLALVRATLGVLNYTNLGLGPALVFVLASVRAPAPDEATQGVPAAEPAELAEAAPPISSGVNGVLAARRRATTLAYATPDASAPPGVGGGAVWSLLSTAFTLSDVMAALGAGLCVAYALGFRTIHDVPAGWTGVAGTLGLLMGLGAVARLYSDPPAAVLQTSGRIFLDNVLLASSEVAWVASCFGLYFAPGWRMRDVLIFVGFAYLISGALLWAARMTAAAHFVRYRSRLRDFDPRVAGRLLRFGSGVALAQAADLLFAPVAYVLANRLISPRAVADLAPAGQIDAGLLLLVGGLSAVLLPRTALAHAAGDARAVLRYYVRGTLASAALLTAAALAVWAASPWIFRLWLGDSMPGTQAILPLILLHTVIGGCGAVGRSVLLAMGRVRAFTASVFVTGVVNVVLSYVLVKYFGWGLYGIAAATTVAAVGRSVVWMPWYVSKTVRQQYRSTG